MLKKGYISHLCPNSSIISKDDNKNKRFFRVITLRAILLLANQVRDLKYLDLLDFENINNTHKSQDNNTNFCLMKKKVCIVIEKWINLYCQENIIIRFGYSNIIFTNVMYIFILINILYSVNCSCFGG